MTRAERFAADHAEMRRQEANRRFTGRPLGVGDLVQQDVGDEIREVTELVSLETVRARWPIRGGAGEGRLRRRERENHG